MIAGFKPIHQELMNISDEIFVKKHIFSTEELYNLAKRKTNYSSGEILNAIEYLVKNKYLVQGTMLKKDNLLGNENRQKILKHISENPASNLNDLMSKLNLGPHSARWHLAMLKRFGLIKNQKISNNIIYFITSFPYEHQEIAFILKRPKSQKILEFLKGNPGINQSELSNISEISYSTLSYQLDIMEKIDLIKKVKEGKNIKLFLNENKCILIEELLSAQNPSEKKDIELLREFDYVGGQIRFKVAIRNNMDSVVTHIACALTSSRQFKIIEEIKRIDILGPRESRGLDFMLEPLTCGRSEIFGTVSYKNTSGMACSVIIQPLEVWIKCPLVESEKLDLKNVEKLKKELSKASYKINFDNLPRQISFEAVKKQVSSLDLSEIYYDQDQLHIIYSGIAKITDDIIIVEIITLTSSINIDIYTRDIKQATGFLAWLQNLIAINFETSQKLFLKTEKMNKRLSECFELSKILNVLIENCESKVSIQEIINIINEIINRLIANFENLTELKSLKRFNEKLLLQYGIDSKIPEPFQVDLIYYAISLNEKLLEISKSDSQLFLDSFEEINEFKDQKSLIDDTILNFQEELSIQYRKYINQIANYIIIIFKESGSSILEERISGKEFNADLLSGFIQAIQSFGIEIHKGETSISKMIYKDFEIIMEEGEYIRTAIICSNKSIGMLSGQLKRFVEEFEIRHKQDLKDFGGNIKIFRDSRDLISKFFRYD
ncbi:MAG: winged helix-turn-helix transcriptional regulator [Candidatus Lokiarchaeota archaeon]|nr:winged helix-turn-helix transcriptional regulator [Candidatus Lokiarchaeota archaeon]